MTTAPVTYAHVRRILDQPIDRVWDTIAAFGGLERWAAGVTGCSVEGRGLGAIRTISIGSRQARERLEAIDASTHRLRYHILPPHSMPAEDVHSEIVLTPLHGDRTAVIWRSEAVRFSVPPHELGARIETFYARSLERLEAMLETA